MTQPTHIERTRDAQRTPSIPAGGSQATPRDRSRDWNPLWGWGLFALVVVVAMAIAFLFGGNQDYS